MNFDKKLKNMLGKSKSNSFNFKKFNMPKLNITSPKKKGASLFKQKQWASFGSKKRNSLRNILPDTDGDRVPNKFDCSPFNVMRQDSKLTRKQIWSKDYYNKHPELKQKIKEYNLRPDVIARRKELYNTRKSQPGYNDKKKTYDKAYIKRPEVKERRKQYLQQPEVKERMKGYQDKYKETNYTDDTSVKSTVRAGFINKSNMKNITKKYAPEEYDEFKKRTKPQPRYIPKGTTQRDILINKFQDLEIEEISDEERESMYNERVRNKAIIDKGNKIVLDSETEQLMQKMLQEANDNYNEKSTEPDMEELRDDILEGDLD
jgi:hypothetical protein